MTSDLQRAAELLKQGKVVGVPTETVYGLAGRIGSVEAINSIFTIKERPFFDPLIVHVSDLDQAMSLFLNWSTLHQVLAENFWPGPLTLVDDKTDLVSGLITSGLNTVGVRLPDHDLALDLIRLVGEPLAAPSANKFGRTSPTTAAHVVHEFKDDHVFVLDGGSCRVGIESTILHLNSKVRPYEIQILRTGMLVPQKIMQVLQENNIECNLLLPRALGETSLVTSPGSMKHHYMPNKPLIIDASQNLDLELLLPELKKRFKDLPNEIEGVRLVKPKKVDSGAELVLHERAEIAARELYAKMRSLAEMDNVDFLYFHETAAHRSAEWIPIIDRLRRAASLIVHRQP